MPGALRRETLGDLHAVDRLHPVEGFRDGARLVRLQRPDEVPLDLGVGMARPEKPALLHPFLHVVLPEGLRTRAPGRLHGFDAEGFAHGEQRDAALRRAFAQFLFQRPKARFDGIFLHLSFSVAFGPAGARSVRQL